MRSYRLPDDLMREVQDYLNARGLLPTVIPWTATDFIISAIKDKLAHIRRSNAKKLRQNDWTIDLADFDDDDGLKPNIAPGG
jgi:ribosomal protein L1